MIKNNHFMIGGLAEAKNYHQPIDIPIEQGDEYYSNLKEMTIIRKVEEIIGYQKQSSYQHKPHS